MKCLKVPFTHKTLDPTQRPMTPWIQVKSASDKPQLAGRQPSSAVGCPGWRPGGTQKRDASAGPMWPNPVHQSWQDYSTTIPVPLGMRPP